VSLRKLAGELDISKTTVQRILKNDLGYRPYKKRIEPLLTDNDKEKRIKFANWIRHNFRKEKTLRILFSDEKMFDLDGMYNAQNDRVWAVNRTEADKKRWRQAKAKVSSKSYGLVRSMFKRLDAIGDFGQRDSKSREVYQGSLANKVFGNDWTFQQDGAKPHTHHLSQEWCQ
jgi:hypothetical protein